MHCCGKKGRLAKNPIAIFEPIEKYHLSHDVIYKMVLDSIPLNAQLLIKAVHQKVRVLVTDHIV